jgi:single-stranded-DNA-specific exonuclease
LRYKLIENSANDINDIVGTVLRNRGVENPQEYLNLNECCINDYNNLNNINEAVECFEKHFERRDDIAVLVDCDP